MGDFNKDLKYGEIGENIAIIKLFNNLGTKQLIDVRKDEWFQKIDVDFLQSTSNGRIVKIEVKTDRQAHLTNNFVFETQSKGNVGCLARSRADYVYYYVEGNDQLYMVVMKGLRKFLDEHHFNEVSMGDGAKGYLVPFKALLENGIAVLI